MYLSILCFGVACFISLVSHGTKTFLHGFMTFNNSSTRRQLKRQNHPACPWMHQEASAVILPKILLTHWSRWTNQVAVQQAKGICPRLGISLLCSFLAMNMVPPQTMKDYFSSRTLQRQKQPGSLKVYCQRYGQSEWAAQHHPSGLAWQLEASGDMRCTCKYSLTHTHTQRASFKI